VRLCLHTGKLLEELGEVEEAPANDFSFDHKMN
jgi:hypothetical protein